MMPALRRNALQRGTAQGYMATDTTYAPGSASHESRLHFEPLSPTSFDRTAQDPNAEQATPILYLISSLSAQEYIFYIVPDLFYLSICSICML